MSSMNVETWLDEELVSEFTKLSELELGTEKHKVAVDELTKLLDRKIDLIKTEIDCEDRAAVRENEQALKEQQMAEEKKDRTIKNILSAAGIALPLLVTIWGTKVSLKFEEEGTFTTIMGRGFINKLLPKK